MAGAPSFFSFSSSRSWSRPEPSTLSRKLPPLDPSRFGSCPRRPCSCRRRSVAWWVWQEAFANPLTLVQRIGFAAGFFAIVAASIALSRRFLFRFPSSFGVASIAGAALLLPLLAALPAFSLHRDVGRAGERPGSVRRVILIVVDTLRADALSSNGRSDAQTRHLDELARESFVFKNAYSSASWTLPSMSSLLTGLFPSVYLATKPASRLPRKLPTLASYLGRRIPDRGSTITRSSAGGRISARVSRSMISIPNEARATSEATCSPGTPESLAAVSRFGRAPKI